MGAYQPSSSMWHTAEQEPCFIVGVLCTTHGKESRKNFEERDGTPQNVRGRASTAGTPKTRWAHLEVVAGVLRNLLCHFEVWRKIVAARLCA